MIGIATRAAHHTIRPTKFCHKLQAIIEVSKEGNCFDQSEMRFHELIISGIDWYVKYIFALKRASDKRVALAGRPKPDACEVCAEPGRRIVFDHCHANGQFRGWICDRCNKTLGMVKDSPRLLIMLAEYLTNGEAHVEANDYAAKQTA